MVKMGELKLELELELELVLGFDQLCAVRQRGEGDYLRLLIISPCGLGGRGGFVT